jgi:D-xylose 1-dehydrogenase
MSSHNKFAKYPSLVDRVVVISGGAMGIGASFVEHFAVQGSQVHFLDIATDAAEELIQKVSSLQVKHQPVFHRCDLTDIEGSLKPTAAGILNKHPKVHAVINNAAGTVKTEKRPSLEISLDHWEASLNVNLRHQFFLTQALMPGLLAAENPSIINMGSITWAIPATGILGYTTSKAGVVGLTRTLAHEFGPKGVRVNSIMPGSISTEREKRDVLTPEYEARVLGNQAIKRLLQPDDVARTALWLVADDSGGVTNQSIHVDGGWT